MKNEKIALITGASKGIGRAIALALAEDGFSIWFLYKNDVEEAQITKRGVESFGQHCLALQCDVTDKDAVDTLLEPLLDRETPFALINNAGYCRDCLFGLMSDEQWKSVLDVHLNGFFYVTRKVVPYMMRARKGRIISVASVSALMGSAGQVNYAAAKSGIIGATKSLARELAPRNILVNAVAPGLIETAMTKNLPLEDFLRLIPLKRIGKPEEVAGCVRFLCSSYATYITGQVLSVNGGLDM